MALKGLIVRDRSDFFESLAFRAQTCADNGDLRETYQIVKQLAGHKRVPAKAVKLADGSVSCTTRERCDK